jgi:hypothetical protein
MSFWQPIKRQYVSEIDQFLLNFDKKPEASSHSRRKEEAEYKQLFKLRDHVSKDSTAGIWEEF